jgi:hypothetical protein
MSLQGVCGANSLVHVQHKNKISLDFYS